MSRKMEWTIFIIFIISAVLLWRVRGRMTIGEVDSIIEEPITLIPSDKFDLSCAMDKAVEDFACAYVTRNKARIPASKPELTLAPYKTTRGIMYLIPGLFEDPAVHQRLLNEPPANKPRDQMKRFTALCRLQLVEKVDGFYIRWTRTDSWHEASPTWIAVSHGCQIKNP